MCSLEVGRAHTLLFGTKREAREAFIVDKHSLTRLFQYHYWANHRLWRPVMALSDEQFAQAPGDGSPSVRSQIVRMVANENLWVNYLWHGEVEFLQESDLPTRASIRAEWNALEEEICDFIDELDSGDLERTVTPPFITPVASLTVADVLLHVIQFAIERRAEICLHLRRLDSSPPPQDYFDFLVAQSKRGTPHMPVIFPARAQPASR